MTTKLEHLFYTIITKENVLWFLILITFFLGVAVGNMHYSISNSNDCNNFIAKEYIIPELEQRGYKVLNGVVYEDVNEWLLNLSYQENH